MCWTQASLEAKGEVTVLGPYLLRVRHHQLLFASMRRALAGHPTAPRRRRPCRVGVAAAGGFHDGVQLRLMEVPRDFTGFVRARDADVANPFLIEARHAALVIAEARGWPRGVVGEVDRALVILLSRHRPGDRVRHSEMFPALRAHGLSVGRTVEIIEHLGLFEDDRRSAFDIWLERKLDGVAPGIGADVEAWARALRHGGPRCEPRSRSTLWNYFAALRPTLIEWSGVHGHLREVTRKEIVAACDAVHGKQRESRVVALRSLFRHAKKTGTIFGNPTLRIHVGRQPGSVILSLSAGEVAQAVDVATTPAVRLIVALAAVHAARPTAIRHLLLDDVDLGNRRLVVAGHARPLDDLTRRCLLNWLNYRSARWPATANPHVLVTQQTALGHGPAGRLWVTDAVRGLTATLEALRVDRQLDEALTHGPDPLHLAAVFGIDDKTAIRYADAARQLLTCQIEEPRQ
ncbi:MAG: hypothetical protein M3083_06215 [Actinomycetota bacterium]|nr:hypothetical protein [Actinomycetota bacterium]